MAQRDVLRPSVFTAALVDGLRSGKADLDGDGEISVDEWYTYAFREVTAQGLGQVPTKSSSAMSGAFIIAQSPYGGRLSTSLLEDLRHDRVPIRLSAVSQLLELAQRPGGIAVAARRELQRLQAEDDSSQVRAEATRALAATAAFPAPTSITTSAPITPAPVAPVAPPVPPTPTPPISTYVTMAPSPPSTSAPVAPVAPPVRPTPTPAVGRPAPARPSKNPLALIAVIMAAIGLVLLFCPVIPATGAILGHVAKGQCIRQQQPGRGLAIVAIIVGWAATLLGVVFDIMSLDLS
ncbi:MAG TPA: DUF4190 domain-containing protein [Candidatus Limnocylindrales bacterium]|nr:DUF4190 domain-containing protein [Candidatus Limnocylindrales bacterium]